MQVLRRAFFFPPRGANNRESLLEFNCTILTKNPAFQFIFWPLVRSVDVYEEIRGPC